MPTSKIEVADLLTEGPVIQVVLAPTRAAAAAMEASGDVVPAGVRVQAMIDTGAKKSYVKHEVLAPLDLHPVGIAALNTASDHHVICPVYAVRLGLQMAALEITVVEGPVSGMFGESTQMLLGRDVLRFAMLVYMGSEDEFTLSF